MSFISTMMVYYTGCLILLTIYVFGPLPAFMNMDEFPCLREAPVGSSAF